MRRAILGSMAAVCLLFPPRRLHAQVSFTPLGSLETGLSSRVNDLSADGKIAIGAAGSGSGAEGFQWTSENGMVGLGDLPGGALASEAFGISGDGSVIVGQAQSAQSVEAVRWSETEGIVTLGRTDFDRVFASARATSFDGSVIVGDADVGVPVRWTAEAGAIEMQIPEINGHGDSVRAVSDDGTLAVGYSINTARVRDATIWSADGTPTIIYNGLALGHESLALGVSGDGKYVVGEAYDAQGGPFNQAFLWTQLQGPVLLGVPAGMDKSGGWDVSSDGAIVAGAGSIESPFSYPQQRSAYLWDAQNGWRNIHNLLTDAGIDLTGWHLTEAVALSNDGTIVAGNGINPDGQGEAWIAVIPIPEPTTLMLLLGLTSLLNQKAF